MGGEYMRKQEYGKRGVFVNFCKKKYEEKKYEIV